jgi:hypothetical protein
MAASTRSEVSRLSLNQGHEPISDLLNEDHLPRHSIMIPASYNVKIISIAGKPNIDPTIPLQSPAVGGE